MIGFIGEVILGTDIFTREEVANTKKLYKMSILYIIYNDIYY